MGVAVDEARRQRVPGEIHHPRIGWRLDRVADALDAAADDQYLAWRGLRDADQKDLVLALRGAPPEVTEVVTANMSERGAAMLKEEMEVQQPQRKRAIDEAQSRIVAVVRRLEEAGAIVIARDDDDASEAVV